MIVKADIYKLNLIGKVYEEKDEYSKMISEGVYVSKKHAETYNKQFRATGVWYEIKEDNVDLRVKKKRTKTVKQKEDLVDKQ